MTDKHSDIDELKRKLRKLKRLEMKLRFGMPQSENNQKGYQLVERILI